MKSNQTYNSISSTRERGLAPTQFDVTREGESKKDGMPVPAMSLVQQETAARLLLSRRELIGRVRDSLRPLRSGQIKQILIGIGLIILGVQCWAPNTSVQHKLICGLILHVYGIFIIGGGAHVCTRIGRIDYSMPVKQVRERLDRVRKAYLLAGPLVGFPWWLMWIPVSVAIGFDAVLHPYCIWPCFGYRHSWRSHVNVAPQAIY